VDRLDARRYRHDPAGHFPRHPARQAAGTVCLEHPDDPGIAGVAAVGAAVGGLYLAANAAGGKSSEQINQDMGYDPLKRIFGNENQNYASSRNIEMLANLKSQPKIEVINNIKVDKDGKVSVETNSNSKDTSAYSAPVMSPFSLGY